jgi:hypothetical protein
MEPKRCYPLISNLMRPELSSTQRSKQKKLVKMASTSSRRHESRPWPDQHSISSSCDDTQPENPPTRVSRRRSRTPAGPKHQGHAQAVLSMGGTVHCQPGARQWGILPHRRTRAQKEQGR